MAFENPLCQVWDNYRVANEGLKRVYRSVGEGEDTRRSPVNDRLRMTGDSIDTARQELNRLFVVSLWATFERTVIEYIQEAAVVTTPLYQRRFVDALNKKLAYEVERWRIEDLLLLLAAFIDRNLLGQIRQIKRFRDGMVHRNPSTIPSRTVAPDSAFKTLSSALEAVHHA